MAINERIKRVLGRCNVILSANNGTNWYLLLERETLGSKIKHAYQICKCLPLFVTEHTYI